MPTRVLVYSEGLCYMSACAPSEMSVEEVVDEIRKDHIAGTAGGWLKSDNETFSNGMPNPCPCPNTPGRTHWLLSC